MVKVLCARGAERVIHRVVTLANTPDDVDPLRDPAVVRELTRHAVRESERSDAPDLAVLRERLRVDREALVCRLLETDERVATFDHALDVHLSVEARREADVRGRHIARVCLGEPVDESRPVCEVAAVAEIRSAKNLGELFGRVDVLHDRADERGVAHCPAEIVVLERNTRVEADEDVGELIARCAVDAGDRNAALIEGALVVLAELALLEPLPGELVVLERPHRLDAVASVVDRVTTRRTIEDDHRDGVVVDERVDELALLCEPTLTLPCPLTLSIRELELAVVIGAVHVSHLLHRPGHILDTNAACRVNHRSNLRVICKIRHVVFFHFRPKRKSRAVHRSIFMGL